MGIFGPIFSNVNKYSDVLENTNNILKQRASSSSRRTRKGQIRNTKQEIMLRKNFIQAMIITFINDYYLSYLLIKTLIIECVLILAHGYGGNNSCRMIAKGGA